MQNTQNEAGARGLIAKASTEINAPVEKVWQALTDPAQIKQYMFGSNVETDWKVGSLMTWRGEWNGQTYEDKGYVIEVDENKALEYSHYSPLTGKPDVPESYHNVRIELFPLGDTNTDTGDKEEKTMLTLTQDNNADEESVKNSEKNWAMALGSMKNLLETKS